MPFSPSFLPIRALLRSPTMFILSGVIHLENRVSNGECPNRMMYNSSARAIERDNTVSDDPAQSLPS
jgi:hypothetical protein